MHTTTYRMKGKSVLRRIGPDHLIVPVSGLRAKDHCIFPINETGAACWEQLVAGRSVVDAARHVSETYDVSVEEAEKDCWEFAARLEREQLLEPMSI